MKRLKQPSGQMARWLSDVDRYYLHVEYRPGRVHWNTDALSRWPCIQCGNDERLCDPEVSFSLHCRLADFPVSWGEHPCKILETAEDTTFWDVSYTLLAPSGKRKSQQRTCSLSSHDLSRLESNSGGRTRSR